MRKIYEQDVEDIATGASFMGAGGGGDPYVGKLMAKSAIKRGNPVSLINVDELDPEAIYAPVACMGAPSVMTEKFPKGDEFQRVLQAVADQQHKKIGGIFPIEAGGVNSMIPFVLGAQTGIPVVDVDSMGRAFPELQMTTLHLAGVTVPPMAITDEKGNMGLLDTVTDKWAELLARDMTVEMGATAVVSLYSTTGEKLQEAGIAGILTKCQQVGQIVRQHSKGHDWQLQQLHEITNSLHLFDGKVVDVSQNTSGGFNHGQITIDGLNSFSGKTMTIDYQNENLVAHVDGQLAVSVPDLICLADIDSLTPFTAEDVRYGKRMAVFGLPCDEKWRTPAGIETVGPRYFGYDYDYQPDEELAKERG